MLQHTEQLESGQNALVSAETVASDQQTQVTPPSEPATRSDEAPADPLQGNSQRHAEAGRKGAYRIHELVRLGRLYEQEHGLKRGRQRRRQLIEEGKLYEREHGIVRPDQVNRKRRGPRINPRQAVRGLLQGLVQVAKPKYRPELIRLLQTFGS